MRLAALLKSDMMYEARPWFCLALGAIGLMYAPHTALPVSFSLILFFCAGMTIRWRMMSRRAAVSRPRPDASIRFR